MKVLYWFSAIFLPIVFFTAIVECSSKCYADIQVGKSTGTLDFDAEHITIGTTPVKQIDVYDGGTLKKVWEDVDGPAITAFSVAPNSIDLDTRASGTVTFTIGVTGTAGRTTTAQIVRLPDGTNIGPTLVSGGGTNITTTVPNILQPNQTTTYRLIASNGSSQSHKDTTVTVTKNPTLTNCRRTGYIDATTTYYFAFTLTGLPRPTVTYAFSGGQQGTFVSRHFVQGSNPYTWNVPERAWRITFANSNAQSLTLTATNASGTATCRIANINN